MNSVKFIIFNLFLAFKLHCHPTINVEIYNGLHVKSVVKAEIAMTNESQRIGLMWRDNLPDGNGMLFIFEGDKNHSIWMKNTLIPLDIIFIDRDKKIIGIIENVQPLTLTSRSIGQPSRYVLEVPGNWSKKAGITIGDNIKFHN